MNLLLKQYHFFIKAKEYSKGLTKQSDTSNNYKIEIWLHSFFSKWEGFDPVNRFNHTSWVAVVTPPDRSKSVRNRGGIDVLVAFLCCPVVSWFSMGVGDFVIGLTSESDLFLDLSYKKSKVRRGVRNSNVRKQDEFWR